MEDSNSMSKSMDAETRERRIKYAIRRFHEEGITFDMPEPGTDRFTVYNDMNTRRWSFYAGSGNIIGPHEERGIENMVMIATKGRVLDEIR